MESKILIKAIISYDGNNFYGLQTQPNKKTIIGEIDKSLKKLNIHTKIAHAGRTDRGVHALNQVISFFIPNFWNLEKLKNILNKMLAPDIYFKKILIAPPNFNPRAAKKRSYRYLLSDIYNPFIAKYITYYPNIINYQLINEALHILKGEHDFEYFAKTGSDVKHYRRIIYDAKIFKYKHLNIIKISSNGFLRGEIRIIVDFLLKINEYKLTLNDLKKQLNKEKLISKHLAPPNGLYLERIWY